MYRKAVLSLRLTAYTDIGQHLRIPPKLKLCEIYILRAGFYNDRITSGGPGLGLRLVNLPGFSPDFNAGEAVWGWAREEAAGILCLETESSVQERVSAFPPASPPAGKR